MRLWALREQIEVRLEMAQFVKFLLSDHAFLYLRYLLSHRPFMLPHFLSPPIDCRMCSSGSDASQ